jgi:hypothetical protein
MATVMAVLIVLAYVGRIALTALGWVMALFLALLALTMFNGCALNYPPPELTLDPSAQVLEATRQATEDWAAELSEEPMRIARGGIPVSMVEGLIPSRSNPEDDGACGGTYVDHYGDLSEGEIDRIEVSTAGKEFGCPSALSTMRHELAHVLCYDRAEVSSDVSLCNKALDARYVVDVHDMANIICPYIGCEP